jgi:hypothetical protein
VKALEVKVRNTDILFAAVDDVEILQKSSEDIPVAPASREERVLDAYKAAKDVIGAIAEDVGEHLRSIARIRRPQKAEMEFGISFSGEAKALVLSGKGEATLKVKLIWDLASDD